MTIRKFFSTLAVFFTLQTLVMAADATAPHSDAAWISFSETPIDSTEQKEFHARATRNVDPKLLKIFSAHVSRGTDLRLLLESYCDAKLNFRSDNFLVTRIKGNNVTIAVGKEFSELAVRKLAKQLRAMSFHIDIVPPEALLQRNDHQAQNAPEYIVPYATPSQE